MKRIFKNGLVGTSMVLLIGCGANKSYKPLPKIAESELTLAEMQKGVVGIAILYHPNLNLQDIKTLFESNFDESSKTFNDKTQGTEYKFYPFGRSNPPTVLGFNSKNEYIYFIDKGGKKNPKPPKIIYVREQK